MHKTLITLPPDANRTLMRKQVSRLSTIAQNDKHLTLKPNIDWSEN